MRIYSKRIGINRISRGAKIDKTILDGIDRISEQIGLSRNCTMESILRIGLDIETIAEDVSELNKR